MTDAELEKLERVPTWCSGQLMALCRNPECIRVIAPGAEYCCGSCMLADAVGYPVPDTDSLGHTELCELRQRTRQRT